MTAALTAVLADDVADLRQLYRLVLEGSGRFTVVAEAGDGETAVELARQHQPQLVLLDVSMPVLDGLEALPRILSASPASRVVMLTGFSADRLGGVALQRGAVGYLEKGLTPAQLIAELLRILGEMPQASPPATPRRAGPEASPDATVLSAVAHEIRNPLNVVHGFAAILESNWETLDRDQVAHLIERIASNTRYLDGVVRSLLSLGSLEAGDALLDLTDRDPAAVVEEVLAVIRDEHPDRPVVLEVGEGLRPVRVDVERFRQVLANLVGNADRYAPRGTPVTVSVHADGAGTTVCVADEGPGIPPADRDRIFERFVRLQVGGPGAGLGLYISRLLMTAMGGSIAVVDSPVGARICCRLAPASDAG